MTHEFRFFQLRCQTVFVGGTSLLYALGPARQKSEFYVASRHNSLKPLCPVIRYTL